MTDPAYLKSRGSKTRSTIWQRLGALRFDLLPYAVGMIITHTQQWSPIGRPVSILIEDSCDQRLIQRRVHGIIRAFDPKAAGQPLLIHLQRELSYRTPSLHRRVAFLVATAATRWHAPSRLLVAWAAVRLVDAPSFADQKLQPTIGTGRMTLVQ
jgi:membrane-associated phospholipid phosphatase